MKTLRITIEGQTYEVTVEDTSSYSAHVPTSAPAPVQPAPAPAPVAVARPAPAPVAAPAPAAAGEGDVVSPLAAVVVEVNVAAGQKVAAGDKLITLEAMKMNTFVNAPAAGTVGAVHVKAGDAVEEGQALVKIS